MWEEEEDIERFFQNHFSKLFTAKEELDMDEAVDDVERYTRWIS